MKNSPLVSSLAVTLSLFFSAYSCVPDSGDDSDGTGGDDGSGGRRASGGKSGTDETDGDTDNGTAGSASGGEGGGSAELAPCEEPTGAGTIQNDSITEDTTWTAEGSPYHVPYGFTIAGATLHLEACTVVLLGGGAYIEMEDGGALVAEGEVYEDEDGELVPRVVAFGPEEEGTYWGSLIVTETGTLDLLFTGLVGGGSINSDGVISADGHNGSLPVLKNIRARGVYIDDAETYGVNLGRYAAFTDDSVGLEITQVGVASDVSEIEGFPVRTSLGGLSTLPTGDFHDNLRDAILVDDGYRFADDVAIHTQDVPYYFPSGIHIDGDDEHPGPFKLSIEAGTVLAFAEDTRVDLGTSSDVYDPAYFNPVQLVLEGTAEEPIVFTSAAEAPAAGDWVGIHWQGGPSEGNVFDHVTVEYAGGDAQASGSGCGNSETAAALVIYSWLPADEFVTQSTFAHSAGGGIISGWDAMVSGPNLRGDNTFTDINPDFCEVSQPKVDGACPGGDSEPDCY